jgi:very-short-patch-repair endonuclease
VSARRFNRTSEKTGRARSLRVSATLAERRLWSCLRAAGVEGASFRRQHPAGSYVLDFYCAELRLAIEVDGGQHAFPRHAAVDRRKDDWLRRNGITVLRYWNSDIMENIDGVVEDIRLAIVEARKHARGSALKWINEDRDRRP